MVRHEPHQLARERCGSFVTASYRPAFGSGSSGLGVHRHFTTAEPEFSPSEPRIICDPEHARILKPIDDPPPHDYIHVRSDRSLT